MHIFSMADCVRNLSLSHINTVDSELTKFSVPCDFLCAHEKNFSHIDSNLYS